MPHPTSGAPAQAGPRLPGRDPRRAAVPVRHLAAAGHRRAARGRARPRDLRRPRGPPAAARGDRPPARAVARASPPSPTRSWSPTAPSRPSTWSPGCWSRPATSWPSRSPGYPLARDVFASYGARWCRSASTSRGWSSTSCPPTTRLVFTTPSHQFPYGPPLSLDRRRALLDFAGRHRCAVIEDDYDSEFRFTERPLETLLLARRRRSGALPRHLLQVAGARPAVRLPGRARAAPGRAARRAPARRSATSTCPCRRRWPGSSRTACSPGTCAGPGRRTASGGRWCSRRSTARWPPTSSWCRARPGCTSPPLLRDQDVDDTDGGRGGPPSRGSWSRRSRPTPSAGRPRGHRAGLRRRGRRPRSGRGCARLAAVLDWQRTSTGQRAQRR